MKSRNSWPLPWVSGIASAQEPALSKAMRPITRSQRCSRAGNSADGTAAPRSRRNWRRKPTKTQAMNAMPSHHSSSGTWKAPVSCRCSQTTMPGMMRAAASDEPRDAMDSSSRWRCCSFHSGSAGPPPCSELVAIHVEPAPAFAHEAAALMQAHRAAAHAVARDEFHLGTVLAGAAEVLDRQPQPACRRLEVQRGRPLAGVPGGQQIGGVLAHEGAVARAHQGLGIGRGAVVEMVQVAAAAGIEGQGTALGILKTAGTGLESGGSAHSGWPCGTCGTCRSEEHTSELQSQSNLVCRIIRSEKHTSELQSQSNIVCRILLEKNTAAVLYQYGTGPVRGFAVTLLAGIAASMISTIFVVRTFYMIWLNRSSEAQTTLSI